MKAILAAAMMVALTACAARTVEVETGDTPATGVAIELTNNANQAVNVYVTSGGNDILIGQVPANSTQQLPVSGVAAGSSVTLKARLVDGTRTYTKDNVLLSGTYSWQVP